MISLLQHSKMKLHHLLPKNHHLRTQFLSLWCSQNWLSQNLASKNWWQVWWTNSFPGTSVHKYSTCRPYIRVHSPSPPPKQTHMNLIWYFDPKYCFYCVGCHCVSHNNSTATCAYISVSQYIYARKCIARFVYVLHTFS